MKRLTQRQIGWMLLIALFEAIFYISIGMWISNPIIYTIAVRVNIVVGALLLAPLLFRSSD
jgi:hypothetical protein